MASKVLSVYIGNDAIRIAEMQKTSKHVELTNAAEIATPDSAIQDGYLMDISAIAEAIRTATFGRGFTAKEVIFTVQSKKIASKEVKFPYMKNQKALQNTLLTNSNEFFPMSNPNDYTFAYSIIENFMTEEGRAVRVSAVAAPVDLIRGYYQLAEEIKYKVAGIDYFGNSVMQLLKLQMQQGRIDLVLQIEKDATYANVMRGPVLLLQRSINYGSNAVVNALMDVKKISEKDAKLLLGNEQLLDQHVTAEEYAEAVSHLVSEIGRFADFHKSKNKGEELQGIKIFGEGSAIAGIEKILQRELGAPVEHFESLVGVQISGHASLTAKEVLRYLPNIGAVIDPMNLDISDAGNERSTVSGALVNKVLAVLLIVATIGSAAYTGYIVYQKKQAEDRKAQLEANIAAIQDIEQIAADYEEAMAQYGVVAAFEESTHSDNELLLKFINELEACLPTESYISGLSAADGNISFSLETGWREAIKNEVADVIVTLGEIDYVHNLVITSFSESYKVVFIESYDEATGEPVYLREEPAEGQEEGELISIGPDDEIPEEYADYEIVTLVQTSYSVSLHISEPVVVEETEDGEAVEGEATEEGGEN